MAEQKLTQPVDQEDHSLGPVDAAVTLICYGDYQCPYTEEFRPLVRLLLQTFPFDLRYVFRHFPISLVHEHAETAAEAAECAAAQGQFWPMHELLFDEQGDLSRKRLLEHANRLSLNVGRFRSDLDSHRYRDRVNRDVASGNEGHLESTPSLFINGVFYSGTRDYDSLSKTIQDARTAVAA